MTNTKFHSANNANGKSNRKSNVGEPLRPMFRGSSYDDTPLNSDRNNSHV